MNQLFQIHPNNPQQRLISKVISYLNKGGVIVYPTASGYALGCRLEEKNALDRICRIRQLDNNHNFTLMCRDLSEIAHYSQVENSAFHLLKKNILGSYTFILKATKKVPRRLMNEKHKTIGLRVTSNPVTLALLEALNNPIMSTSLILPGNNFTESDPKNIQNNIGTLVDLIIDGGTLGQQPTTVVDLRNVPVVVREGSGDPGPFL
ncbi:L-threonylcarbamoyladenylate synthase [Pantoea sp. Nvir]|uniref:L-threonylcarbamoyladenylate synthase n=1 Tax=Pantoea sp. Nvir TaxID=2576760 RepID=UPI00135A382B|nr:L-threonylcarbamoyladenylate synthase [Pantoea sp. Nvir]MXP66702.1 threonylcarbamoyl-AMP synthase [Pantoea sp. Nvir]CAJ0991792.1 putative protein YciO [Pantoea sp. Nvir]